MNEFAMYQFIGCSCEYTQKIPIANFEFGEKIRQQIESCGSDKIEFTPPSVGWHHTARLELFSLICVSVATRPLFCRFPSQKQRYSTDRFAIQLESVSNATFLRLIE